MSHSMFSTTQLSISTLTIFSIWGSLNPVFAQTHLQQNDLQQDDHNYLIIPVQQLKDLSSDYWSYTAVRSLAENYGCMTGFPDRTFRGESNITRYEFAAGLDACQETIEDRISHSGEVGLNPVFWDSTSIQRAQDGSLNTLLHEVNREGEFGTLEGKIDQVESKVAILENNQFSTTSKLYGEVVFGLGSILAGTIEDGATKIERIPYFGHQINLELVASFTGKDELSIELEAANLPTLNDITDTFQGELAFSGSNENNLKLDLSRWA